MDLKHSKPPHASARSILHDNAPGDRAPAFTFHRPGVLHKRIPHRGPPTGSRGRQKVERRREPDRPFTPQSGTSMLGPLARMDSGPPTVQDPPARFRPRWQTLCDGGSSRTADRPVASPDPCTPTYGDGVGSARADDGATLASIAAEVGCTVSAVRNAADRLGVTRRRAHQHPTFATSPGCPHATSTTGFRRSPSAVCSVSRPTPSGRHWPEPAFRSATAAPPPLTTLLSPTTSLVCPPWWSPQHMATERSHTIAGPLRIRMGAETTARRSMFPAPLAHGAGSVTSAWTRPLAESRLQLAGQSTPGGSSGSTPSCSNTASPSGRRRSARRPPATGGSATRSS